MEISTVWPAYGDEVDAPLLPATRVAARGVPGAGGAGARAAVRPRRTSGSGRAAGAGSTQPAGQLWPVSVVVWPLASGSVVQSSPPGVRASTNRWSHSGSVSYDVQNVIDPPAVRHRDLAGEPLVGHVGDLRVHVLRSGVRVERAARLVVPGGGPALELLELVGRQDPAGRDERRPPGRVPGEDGIVEAPRQAGERVGDADGVEARRRSSSRPSSAYGEIGTQVVLQHVVGRSPPPNEPHNGRQRRGSIPAGGGLQAISPLGS